MRYGPEYMSQDAIARIHRNPKLRPNYQPTRFETLVILSLAGLMLYTVVKVTL